MDEGLNQPVGEQAPPPPPPRRPRQRGWLAALVCLVVVAGLLAAAVAYFGGYAYGPAKAVAFTTSAEEPTAKELSQLERKLAAISPRGVFIVVDTVDNHLLVQKGDQVLRNALCSAGTGSVLEDPKTGKRWVFDSPRGVQRVKEKRKDPVWRKPEWALIEQGEDPSKVAWADRIDRDTLGDYALYLGDGYMIHGTLYQRYLGLNVTHGCIRLGDDDLEFVYNHVPVGATVFLY